MKVLITQPRGKEKLYDAFNEAGAEMLSPRGSYVKPDLIIPVVDEELPTLAYLRPQLESSGIRVMVGSQFTIDICRDKAEFYRFCRRHDFKTPVTMQDEFVLKPRFGKASKGIVMIDRSYILQEKLDGEEVSIDYFTDFQGHCISFIPRYRRKVVDGASTEMERAVVSLEALRLGEELRLVGHNVIQGFLTNKGFVFTEVNPRFGGGSHLTFGLFNSPKWLLEHL